MIVLRMVDRVLWAWCEILFNAKAQRTAKERKEIQIQRKTKKYKGVGLIKFLNKALVGLKIIIG